jgi:hypothetical protein
MIREEETMSSAQKALHVLLGCALLCGCGATSKIALPAMKYNPVRVYNAPYPKVYEAAKRVMVLDKYEIEVDASDPQAGNGMLVTGYITTHSPDKSWTDEKGQKRQCLVKYLIHADIQAVDANHTKLDLRVPETSETYKPGVGLIPEKTETMSWRGHRIQDAIEAILAGKPVPEMKKPSVPMPARQDKGAGK